MPTGSNDSLITLGLDLAEETEQNAGIVLGETLKAGAELTAAAEGPSAFEREQAELEEARAAAEEARQREEAEKQREQEQEKSR
jgi:MoxR-like ATPase